MGWKRIKLTLEEIGRVYPKVFMIILISKKIDYDPKKFSVCFPTQVPFVIYLTGYSVLHNITST